ncbi:putative vacuolar cation/proton exchanger 2 [Eremomyces bilateralis CBS 781.70]|uniref:Vacuolar calcium ion transporter n=1 Tax=Eremomyces bilateralis CBS 781.70 TaxID=1392243 RepID=A0A6G1G5A0_9PEZI|nr:putative vacuolar cation/proton exchanger 2 [Eremomyces bilateralis CBS 781.70]KAF1813234.1 putative vacuolar cation/proton exchanger 2 [Eremomyces bilateralis CBS 781.70]
MRHSTDPTTGSSTEPKPDTIIPPHSSSGNSRHARNSSLPFYGGSPMRITRGIKPEGESGRRGVHPWKFLKICFQGSCQAGMVMNFLWPVVPAAIAVNYARPKDFLAIFILNYIAMIPAANLLGFASQELARKLPKVLGVILETTFGSLVEIVLFMVLIAKGDGSVQIIKAAILGSILANLLLCLGLCFFFGGLRRNEQSFHEAVSEVGSNLMLVAGMGLIIPALFAASVTSGITESTPMSPEQLDRHVLRISRAVAIILVCGYFLYVFFQIRSHHGLYEDLLESDEAKDVDRSRDLYKAKLTLTETLLALALALACVSLIAVFLVAQIHHLVAERHVSDAFVGLILVPLVEKAAEHITAVDEAWDNQMNFALSHVLGSSIQTALLNTPLVVFVGWGLHLDMNLKFEPFDAAVLILAILVVGGFLRDKKSNYLEGALCVMVYVMIAICAYFYPNPLAAEGHH